MSILFITRNETDPEQNFHVQEDFYHERFHILPVKIDDQKK
jgi:hypothetical protein